MNTYFEKEGIRITDDTHFMEKEHGLDADVFYWINKMHYDLTKNKAGTADRLIKLIKKHPKNPQFKNLLTSYYIQNNQSERGYELNRKTIEAHPNYFFAKLNLANEYLHKNEFDKVTELLGENFNLKNLFPERDTFHISEVMSMLRFGAIFHATQRNFAAAEDLLQRMIAIDEDDYEVEFAENFVLHEKLMAANERATDEYIMGIEVIQTPQKETNKTEPPKFNHPEIEQLYHFEMDIPTDLFSNLLQLPRESLLEDLKLIVEDSILRYSFFLENEPADFVIHAFNLLAELDTQEQLPLILHVLSQNEDYIDSYFGFYITEYIWITIYRLGQNQIDLLSKFMLQLGLCTYSKTEVSKAVAQIAIHQPARREEVILWYQRIFESYSKATLKDNIIDSDLIGLMVGDVMDFQGKELLPVIRELFNLGYVSESICGNLETVEHNIGLPAHNSSQMKLLNLFEIYGEMNKEAAPFNSPKLNLGDQSNVYENPPLQAPKTNEPKIGRNEPCSCGSGKKYKKCCLK